MLSLLEELDKISDESSKQGHFMLRLNDRTWPRSLIVDELLRKIVEHSDGVYLPGYKPGWAKGVKNLPAWAIEMERVIVASEVAPLLPSVNAFALTLQEFWKSGSIVERADSSTLVSTFRPALPLISIEPALLARLPWRPFSTELVGFSADLKKRNAFFKSSLAAHRKLAELFPDRVSILYQDAAWLFVLGSGSALREALTIIARSLSSPLESES